MEGGGHEPRNTGQLSLEAEKGKEMDTPLEPLEGNTALLTPWF